jgi:PAS domain S-box-containing protein
VPTVVVALALCAYAAALFVVGWRAQRRGAKEGGGVLACALGLGVYATSWTFYGAVGTAARSGWDYLPIYLGPILAFTLGLPLVARVAALGQAHGATSIADLLSRRFGRSRRLAALVTLTAVLFSLPYVALQLIAVASTYAAVTGLGSERSGILVLLVAATLAGFGLVFGTRSRDITRSSPGLVAAMAFDSVFKLAAFAAVAVAATMVMTGAPGVPAPSPVGGPEGTAGGTGADRFVLLTVLSAFAVLCLPRQFHMAVVTPRSAGQLRGAAPWFAGYLALFALLVLPIAAAGRAMTPGASPDLFVLAVPEALGAGWLGVLAFTGGFAAAAGMVVVTGIALGGMVASDLVLPVLGRRREDAFAEALLVRRASLCVLIGLAALLALVTPQDAPLAGLGTVAFAGAAQFAPLLLAALFVPRATEAGAVAGLCVGVLAWIGFVLGPAVAPGSVADASAVSAAALPFLSDGFTRGSVLSLAANVLAGLAVSLLTVRTLEDRQATASFAIAAPPARGGSVSTGELSALVARVAGPEAAEAILAAAPALAPKDPAPSALVDAAEAQLSRVLGNASADILIRRLLTDRAVGAGEVMVLVDEASRGLRASQALLATTLENLAEGVSMIDAEGRLVAWNRAYQDLFAYPPDLLAVGVPVERLIRHNLPQADEDQVAQRLAHLRDGRPHTGETRLPDGRVLRLQGRPVPGGGYVTSFSDVTDYREAQAALTASERAIRFYAENIPFPIAFCDAHGIIRFHNRAYAQMTGRAGDDLVGEALRGLLGEGYALREAAVADALGGEGARFELGPAEVGGETTWQITYVPQRGPDGRVTGFFGFYQDISRRRAAQAALEEANRTLEARVAARTAEAEAARAEAVAATQSKTRFLAAASHDVLQPLNAARLFASSLEDDLPEGSEQRATAARIGAAVESADDLLRSLLDLSKLDAGGIVPEVGPLALGPWLRAIAEEFAPAAAAKGLTLRAVPTTLGGATDAGLLRSAVQNLVSNALRYTDEGGVVIGARRAGDEVQVVVADSGRGIAEADVARVFEPFARLPRDRDVEGAGLGLATVRRVCDLLGHEVELRSAPGRGTRFTVTLPRTSAVPQAPSRPVPSGAIAGARVLCVDNDASVLEAMRMRFERWGADAEAHRGLPELRAAFANGRDLPDLIVLDYQLDDGATGLDALRYLRQAKGSSAPAILVTASRSPETEAQIAGAGLPVLQKPVEPAALRALSVSLLSARTG